MYNLLVSANPETWQGEPWQIELSRCVNEYTDDAIIEKYGALDAHAIDELRTFPCIFAYETGNNLNPKFGIIRDIAKRQGQVRIEYEIQPVEPFLAHDALDGLRFELDIGTLELHRTHWAVKKRKFAEGIEQSRDRLARLGATRPEGSQHNYASIRCSFLVSRRS